MYRCMQKHAQVYTRIHRDTDACMDGCTHNVSYYIIEVDKLLLKDDCEEQSYRDVFSKKTWGRGAGPSTT